MSSISFWFRNQIALFASLMPLRWQISKIKYFTFLVRMSLKDLSLVCVAIGFDVIISFFFLSSDSRLLIQFWYLFLSAHASLRLLRNFIHKSCCLWFVCRVIRSIE